MSDLHQFARDYFAAFFSNRISEDMFTDDMRAWTTLGSMDRASYVGAVKQIISLFDGPTARLDYVIDEITAEKDRVIVEIHSNGNFSDGEPYAMTYVFVLKVRDGRIAFVAEHFNPLPVMEKMFPRLKSVPETVA